MIIRRIFELAQSRPHKTALIYDADSYTYAQLARAISNARRGFSAYDLPPERTAILMIRNSAEAWVNALALRSLGLTVACMPSLNIANELKIANAACFAYSPTSAVDETALRRIAGDIPIVQSAELSHARIAADDTPIAMPEIGIYGGQILHTSGTTGEYKKLLMEGRLEAARTEKLRPWYGFDSDTVNHVLNFPIWTSMGFRRPISTWDAGGTVIIDEKPGYEARVMRHNPTTVSLIPSMFPGFLQAVRRDNIDLSRINLRIAGGFMSVSWLKELIEQHNTSIEVSYSSTECLDVCLTRFSSIDDYDWIAPVAGRIVEIVDEADRICDHGVEGYLRVKLEPLDLTHYLDDETTTARFFRSGYFYPGDMAIAREDGHVRILGRTADVLNIRGNKIAVGPLEQQIQQSLSVENVCLFGGLGENGREELVVAIEADRMPPPAGLHRIAKAFSAFENVRFEHFVSFPRTEGGMQKIKRMELRKRVFRDSN